MRPIICAFAAAAVLSTAAPVWYPVAAADTDVENPAIRDLPMRTGPISGGRQHQPTPAEVQERAADRALTRAGDPSRPPARTPDRAAGDDLYNRVLKQSEGGTPRSIDPTK
jgi:hypothetical protein